MTDLEELAFGRRQHYNADPSGVECIDIVKNMDFCLGNAVKYIWRAKDGGKTVSDLIKSLHYLELHLAEELAAFRGQQPPNYPIKKVLGSEAWARWLEYHHAQPVMTLRCYAIQLIITGRPNNARKVLKDWLNTLSLEEAYRRETEP